MASRKIKGREMLLTLGAGKVGCAQDLGINLQRAIVEASCREAGEFFDGEAGQISGSVSVSGINIIDNPAEPGNVRASDIGDMLLEGTRVAFVIGPGENSGGTMGTPGDILGSKVWAGFALVTDFEESGSQDGLATYSATLTIVGAVSHDVVATV